VWTEGEVHPRPKALSEDSYYHLLHHYRFLGFSFWKGLLQRVLSPVAAILRLIEETLESALDSIKCFYPDH